MKVPASRADTFVRRPDGHIRVILLYGPDSGLVRERARTAMRGVVDDPNDPFRLADLTGAEIAKDAHRLVDEALSQSLMGGRRAVRVRNAGDMIASAVRAVLDGPPSDSLIVLEGGDLGPRSTLRKACEQADGAAAVPCYQADAGELAGLVEERLRTAGVAADRDAIAYLAERLVGDRQLAYREIDKLILYAGPDGKVDLETARTVVGDSAEQSVDEAVLAAVGGEPGALDRVVEKLWREGTSPVALLRAGLRHLTRLHQARAHMAAGLDAGQAIKKLRPPVFFKQEPAFRRQLGLWSPPALDRAIERLMEAEAGCKRTGAPDLALASRALHGLAQEARRAAMRGGAGRR
jgi:DNA polymerase-3 subunit delta